MNTRGRIEQPNIARRVITAVTSLFPSRNRAARLQPERRSGLRIMTLKNAGWLALSLTVLFLIFSAYMERRSRGTEDYGRLYGRRIDATPAPVTPSQPEVVLEAPETSSGGGLLQRGRGSGVLVDATTPDTPTAAPAPVPATPPVSRPVRARRQGERVVITGGTDGVRVDPQPARREPELGRVPPPPAATTTEPPPEH